MPFGFAGVRHCESMPDLLDDAPAAIGAVPLTALAGASGAAQPFVMIVPVLKKVLDPLNPAGTSFSPTAASLIRLLLTVATWQLNSTAAIEARVMRFD
jgi:hypothetical protein